MYQFNMSVSDENTKWFESIERTLEIKIKNSWGLMATKRNDGRLYISIASDSANKQSIKRVIKDALTDMYLNFCKYDYLKKNLNLPLLGERSYNILLHTLVAFDRDCESSIVSSKLSVNDNLALDGFFNFRLVELKKRWDEIIELAVNNSLYLTNSETFNELLRFLLSAISPKIRRIDVTMQNGCYNVSGKYKNCSFEFRILCPLQLMFYLINIAPLELTLNGDFEKDELYFSLLNIFDAKEQKTTV